MRQFAYVLILTSLVALTSRADCCAATGNDVQQPVRARVVTPGASVYSGPGETCYVTDALAEHTVVEIYHRQPDGWCAVRPPDGSFSWIYSQHVQPVGEGLAKTNKDDVPARVGSRLSLRRNEIQVRLHRGEVVQILGDDQQEGELWFKIAPPAGEFRWVHANDLAPTDSDRSGWEPVATVTMASHEASTGDSADDESEELTAPPLASDTTTTWSTTGGNEAADITPLPTADVRPVSSQPRVEEPIQFDNFDGELAGLELRLSRMVAEPAPTWNVEVLEQAAERLLSEADTVPQRDAVKTTLAKIDRFAAIQRQHRSIHGATAGPPVPRPIATGDPTAIATTDSALPVPVSPYDAVGVLRPVVSRRPGAPQFALVNDAGQVISFLTPAPDLNLQSFLGRRIGVVGSRGYIPEFRRAHVTASRVTPLSDRTIR